MKIFLYALFLLLLLSLVSATSFTYYSVTADVQDETVLFQIDSVASVTDSSLVLSLPSNAEQLEVLVDAKEVVCAQKEELGFSSLICPVSDGVHTFTVHFQSSSPLLSLQDGSFLFEYHQEIIDADRFSLLVTLPQNALLSLDHAPSPYPRHLYSDGKHEVLSWERSPLHGDFSAAVFYSQKQSFSSWIFIVIPLALLLVLFLLFRRKKSDVFVAGALLEQERKVIHILQEHESHLWQKQLELQSGLTKVKLSRLLKSMEKRGLVTRESYGTSKIIRLVEQK
ncbi:hypothetical protein HZA98_00905 [Candidatus Woesearchaeota archaeon]|nr:hypothetical protein [Candidatus Woesearchaeota archaeon]